MPEKNYIFEMRDRQDEIKEADKIQFQNLVNKYQYMSFTFSGDASMIIYIASHSAGIDDVIVSGKTGDTAQLFSADTGLANQKPLTEMTVMTANNDPIFAKIIKPSGLKKKQHLILTYKGEVTVSFKLYFNQ